MSMHESICLTQLVTVIGRKPRDSDIVYDPLDPDFVEVTLDDGSLMFSETAILTGSPEKPMTETAFRAKFDECLSNCKTSTDRDSIWHMLSQVETLDDINPVLQSLVS